MWASKGDFIRDVNKFHNIISFRYTHTKTATSKSIDCVLAVQKAEMGKKWCGLAKIYWLISHKETRSSAISTVNYHKIKKRHYGIISKSFPFHAAINGACVRDVRAPWSPCFAESFRMMWRFDKNRNLNDAFDAYVLPLARVQCGNYDVVNLSLSLAVSREVMQTHIYTLTPLTPLVARAIVTIRAGVTRHTLTPSICPSICVYVIKIGEP